MAMEGPLRQEIQSRFSKGVGKDEIEKVATEIANKTQRKPAIVKALITRYINKGMIKEQGGKYLWSMQ